MLSGRPPSFQVTALEVPALLEGGPTDEELAVIPETEKEVAWIIVEVTLPLLENTTPTPQLPNFYRAACNADAVLRGDFCPSVRLSVRHTRDP